MEPGLQFGKQQEFSLKTVVGYFHQILRYAAFVTKLPVSSD